MYRFPPFFNKSEEINSIYILDFKQGDVTGDKCVDNVYLIGDKPFENGSLFIKNITLFIQDGATHDFTKVELKENAGYNPTIFLGDFTGNKVDDILVSIDSGGSGGYAFYYIYTFVNGIYKKIFDFEKFNKEYKYSVNYKDYYEVELINKTLNKKYIIDIKYKGEKYLSDIYTKDGILKKPIEGWVNPLGGLYPIDFNRNGMYELYALQRIVGRYNADSLGYVQSYLKWNRKNFICYYQTLGIFGE